MEALQPTVAPSPHARKGGMLASVSVPHLPTHLARGSLIADGAENYAQGATLSLLMCILLLPLCSAWRIQWDAGHSIAFSLSTELRPHCPGHLLMYYVATCRSGSAAGDGRAAVQVRPEALCACAPPWPSAHHAAGCPASCPISHQRQVGTLFFHRASHK